MLSVRRRLVVDGTLGAFAVMDFIGRIQFLSGRQATL
jgi:hypothetical protein